MNERSVFLAALDVTDPAARSAFLDETCAADETLRRRVEVLLAAHAGAESFMVQPAPDRDPPAPTGGFVDTDPACLTAFEGAISSGRTIQTVVADRRRGHGDGLPR